jgi:hypothetical protein
MFFLIKHYIFVVWYAFEVPYLYYSFTFISVCPFISSISVFSVMQMCMLFEILHSHSGEDAVLVFWVLMLHGLKSRY